MSIVNYERLDREFYIETLVANLGSLRNHLNFSQEELAEILGIGRQSLLAIENRQRKMRWRTFLALVVIFSSNEKTAGEMRSKGLHLDFVTKFVEIEINKKRYYINVN
jgi:DNA-binding XRE family transcriptional regulator